jgi:hypothetical protein
MYNRICILLLEKLYMQAERAGDDLATGGSIRLMSEIPLEGPEVSLEQVEALGALEKAFEEALSQVPLPYVLSRIVATFPQAASPQIEIERDQLARFHGRVQKVSVSMPEDLATAIRERTGPGGFSRYVTEAVERRFSHDRLGDLLDELEAEYGPVPAELLEWAERQWPDHDE